MSTRGADARFAGAWPGVELRFTAAGDSVKEALIVRDAASVQNYSFDLKLPVGYAPKQRPTGTIEIRDAKVT